MRHLLLLIVATLAFAVPALAAQPALTSEERAIYQKSFGAAKLEALDKSPNKDFDLRGARGEIATFVDRSKQSAYRNLTSAAAVDTNKISQLLSGSAPAAAPAPPPATTPRVVATAASAPPRASAAAPAPTSVVVTPAAEPPERNWFLRTFVYPSQPARAPAPTPAPAAAQSSSAIPYPTAAELKYASAVDAQSIAKAPLGPERDKQITALRSRIAAGLPADKQAAYKSQVIMFTVVPTNTGLIDDFLAKNKSTPPADGKGTGGKSGGAGRTAGAATDGATVTTSQTTTTSSKPDYAAKQLTTREQAWLDPADNRAYKSGKETPENLKKTRANVAKVLPEGFATGYNTATESLNSGVIDAFLLTAVQLSADEQSKLDIPWTPGIAEKIKLKNAAPLGPKEGSAPPAARKDLTITPKTVREHYLAVINFYLKNGLPDPQHTRNPSEIVKRYRAIIPKPAPPAAVPAVAPTVLTREHVEIWIQFLTPTQKQQYEDEKRKILEQPDSEARRKALYDLDTTYFRYAIQNIVNAKNSPESWEDFLKKFKALTPEQRRLLLNSPEVAPLLSKIKEAARKDIDLFNALSDMHKKDVCAPLKNGAAQAGPSGYSLSPLEQGKTGVEGLKKTAVNLGITPPNLEGSQGSGINFSKTIAKNTPESTSVVPKKMRIAEEEGAASAGFSDNVRIACMCVINDCTPPTPQTAQDGASKAIEKDEGKSKPWYEKIDKAMAANLKAGAAGAIVGMLIGSFFAFPLGPIVGAAIGGAAFFGANWLANKAP